MFLLGADEFAELPRLEGAGGGAAARPPRRRDPAGLPARAARRGARAARARPSASRSSSSSRMPIASSELRARLDRGEDVHELVPPAVWELIERDGLYGRAGYTETRLDVYRTGTPDRGAGPGEAREGRRHPRHAAGVHLHRLLRRLHGQRTPRQTKGIWDEVHARLKQDDGLLPALGRRRARGDLDRRRLPRRRPARLHPRGARLLPPRRPLGRRAPGGGRGGERVALLSI